VIVWVLIQPENEIIIVYQGLIGFHILTVDKCLLMKLAGSTCEFYMTNFIQRVSE